MTYQEVAYLESICAFQKWLDSPDDTGARTDYGKVGLPEGWVWLPGQQAPDFERNKVTLIVRALSPAGHLHFLCREIHPFDAIESVEQEMAFCLAGDIWVSQA